MQVVHRPSGGDRFAAPFCGGTGPVADPLDAENYTCPDCEAARLAEFEHDLDELYREAELRREEDSQGDD